MIDQQIINVIHECKARSLQGTITFPEVVQKLQAVGVERYHVDYSRDETTYYFPDGESHVESTNGLRQPVADAFDATAIAAAVRASQGGQIDYPEFSRRVMASGCVGYFTQIAGRRVQYIGRTGDMHVEHFPT